MKEELERELEEWWKEYKKEEKEILKNDYFLGKGFNNQHPINKLNKKYWDKKIEILKKYQGKN